MAEKPIAPKLSERNTKQEMPEAYRGVVRQREACQAA